MDIYDSLSCPNGTLNEQIARQIFAVMPDNGPVMAITDGRGNCWPGDSQKFSRLNLSESFLADLRSRIDDGCDPVVTVFEDHTIVGSQLSTERSDCGYVVLALPRHGRDLAAAGLDLIEIMLAQFNLIATLIEKSNMLYELQMKNLSMYGAVAAPSS